MARGRLLAAHVAAAQLAGETPNYCIGARTDGVVCNKRIPIDALYCAQHMNSPETHRDKVLFYGYLARPMRTELVRRAFHSNNDAVALTALKLLLDGVERYAEPEQTIEEDLTVLSHDQLLVRAKQLVARLEQPQDDPPAAEPYAPGTGV
jgi:hypothetical protein